MSDFFEQHGRLLWGVLARLARRGYVASPGEAQDLIQSFYVEEWPKVLQHFDKSKGSLSTYLARAFYLFSRRRIVLEANWRHRLTDMTNVLDAKPAPDVIAERQEDLASIRNALEALPEEKRSVLVDFLSGHTHERDLAQKHRITRHKLRETLVEALGRIATQLGAFTRTSIETDVAHKLWYEGRTVRDTGRLLNLSTAEVQVHRNKLTARFLRSIRHLSASSLKEQTMNSHLKLLKEVLLSHDEEGLFELKNEAEQVRKSLEEYDLELSQSEREVLDSKWTTRVFEVLAGEDEATSDHEQSISEAIASLCEEEDEEIGRAFADYLLPTLPPEFFDWDVWFKGVPKASRDYQDLLRTMTIVREGGQRAVGLILYGMTPAVFFEAAHGVQLLIDRLLQDAVGFSEDFPRQPDLVLRFRQLQGNNLASRLSLNIDLKHEELRSNCISSSLLISQVQSTPDCPKEAAIPILTWMVKVAQLKPLFFPGYQSETLGEEAIRLTQELGSDRDEELAYRWGKCGQEVEELVCVSDLE